MGPTRRNTAVKIYAIQILEDDIWETSAMLADLIPQTWFADEIMQPADFEQATHVLEVIDRRERPVSSDKLYDVSIVDASILALSERAFPLLPALIEAGCRVADRVKVTGAKPIKLVFPTATLDLLDHEASDLVINDVAGSISAVYNLTVYEEDAPLPLLFRLLWRGPRKSGPTLRIYATQTFVDAYKALELTGVDFYEVKRRSKRPA